MRDQKLRRGWQISMLLLMGLLVFGCTVQPDSKVTSNAKAGANLTAKAFGTSDYATALADAIQFYDGQKCGPDVAVDNVFNWRGACHTTDGADVGVDLTGGFHDAGDHVKFTMPAAYTASMLGWTYMEYKSSLDGVGVTAKLMSYLKRFTDYFLKCHPTATLYYYQVGDSGTDHAYWGPPEVENVSRPTKFKADGSAAASDVLGQSAAALAIMSINYQSIDSAYAAKCLQAAKELYVMATAKLGLSQEEPEYQTYSFYDDVSWAAVWLSVATGDASYLANIKTWVSTPMPNNESKLQNIWTLCWDDTYQAVYVKMAQLTGDQFYKDAAQWNIDYWDGKITPSNGLVKSTPGGLRWLNNWGCLRYAMGATFAAMMYYKQTGDPANLAFAQSQVNYILGSNPQNMSYIIGFGSKFPTHPHHRAANGWTYADPGGIDQAAKHTLTGALVGGPDQSDNFIDQTSQYQYTEPALDYNAGLIGTLAALVAGQVIVSSSSSLSTSSSVSSISSVISTSSSSSSVPTNITYTAIPGLIEAENYFAMSGIQTETCSAGTLDVGWVDTGDWMDYGINVNQTAKYFIDFHTATIAGTGAIDILIDGVKTATYAVPNTGGWQNWTTLIGTINLPAGKHLLRVYASGSPWNLDNFIITPYNAISTSSSSSSQSSSSSIISTIKVEAENYTAMSGIQTESCAEGTLDVGWIDTGDWMEYANYKFGSDVNYVGGFDYYFRVASPNSTGSFDVYVKNASGTYVKTASLTVPNTGGWQNWTSIGCGFVVPDFNGHYSSIRDVKIVATGPGFNIDYFNIEAEMLADSSSSAPFSSSSSSSSSVTTSSSSSLSTSSTSSTISSNTGSLEVQFYNGSTTLTGNQISGRYKLINTGSSTVALSGVKIRYYYTADGTQPQSFWCDYSQAGSGNVTGSFSTLNPIKAAADSCLELGFSSGAGSLAPGAFVEIQTRIAKADWSNYNQNNDYSFNPTATGYVDWNKITAYNSGTIQWGVEP